MGTSWWLSELQSWGAAEKCGSDLIPYRSHSTALSALQGIRPLAKVQAECSAKRTQLQSLQSDVQSLRRKKDQAEQHANQVQQQYKELMDGARAEGSAGILLDLQAQLAALQQQCSKVYIQSLLLNAKVWAALHEVQHAMQRPRAVLVSCWSCRPS